MKFAIQNRRKFYMLVTLLIVFLLVGGSGLYYFANETDIGLYLIKGSEHEMYVIFHEGTDREKIKSLLPDQRKIVNGDPGTSYSFYFRVGRIQGLLLERQLRDDPDIITHGLGFSP